MAQLSRAVALASAQQVVTGDPDIDYALRTDAPVRNSVGSVEMSADRLKRSIYPARIFYVVHEVIIAEAFEGPKNSRFVRHLRIPLRE